MKASLDQLPRNAPAGLCPACRAPGLRRLLDASAPIHTSKLLTSREEARSYPRGSIRLEICETCGLISNTSFDAPVHDYSASYEETQSHSSRFRDYASALARTLDARHHLTGRDVLEIGSGRADFLAVLSRQSGCRGVAVDPSFRDEHRSVAATDGIEVRKRFFSASDVDRAFVLVVCRHTLEHVHDVRGFLTELREGLERWPEATVVFEIPDTLRILRESAFWDVYYEHCSYFTPGSLARAFRAAGFTPTDLEMEFDGQYALVTASVGSAGLPRLPLEEPVAEIVELAGRFVEGVARARAYWRSVLGGVRAAGQTSVVWGAGSKSVGFLATLELGDEIAAAVDVNPDKHGMFLPGTGHEIVAPDRLTEIRPDVVVVMNPAYEGEIRSELRRLGVAARVEVL